MELGRRPVARCDALGAAPYSESADALFRPYLSAAHRSALDRLGAWMAEAQMAVRLDPVGNLIGRYEGELPGAPALLIGSHIDSVRDAGRYDGALGVMLGVECVHALAGEGRRLPFAIEVIAFGDEEGSRFPASMLCSRAVVEGVCPQDLALTDEAGVSVAQALSAFGLDPDQAGAARRAPGEIIAYLEAHIEQGPVLEAEDLSVGVVTGIAAQLRLKAVFEGLAGHAGTSPMGLRHDALAAAAEAVLAVERVCLAGPPDLRGTVGRFLTQTSAYNVIAGRVEIGIDVRAATHAVRDAAAAEIRTLIGAMAKRRGVALDFSIVQDLPASPCDRRLMGLMEQAIAAEGVRPLRLLSGAGHDALTVSALAPAAMLFIRCAGGISHNAAERVDAADVAVAARVLLGFIDRLAEAQA